MQRIDFMLRGEYIALDALLEATGLAGSGGIAKQMISGARVREQESTLLELRESRLDPLLRRVHELAGIAVDTGNLSALSPTCVPL